jgi:hypothetical protein
MEWDDMLRVARRYGYVGPDTPDAEPDVVQLAEALRRAARVEGGRDPWIGTGPRAYIGAVMEGDVPIDAGTPD